MDDLHYEARKIGKDWHFILCATNTALACSVHKYKTKAECLKAIEGVKIAHQGMLPVRQH